jgi:hypothetical protein
MSCFRRLPPVLAGLVLVAPSLHAQPAASRSSLVDLIPADFGLCLVVHDLRGQHERMLKSAWFTAFRKTAAGQAVFGSPELQKLAAVERELAKVFEVDWSTFRDEILGDDVLLAYRPPLPGKAAEEGLVLLRTRQPALLARLIERLNEAQRNNGELRALDTLTYKDKTYYTRNDRGKEVFYLLDGPLLAVASNEETLRSVLERAQAPGPDAALWRERFRRAGAEGSFLALAVNPRVLGLGHKATEGALPPFWQALEAIFITVQPAEALEVRLSIQANPEQLPTWLRSALLGTSGPSSLWQRFPDDTVATLAGRTNFAEALTTLTEMTPPAKRAHLAEAAQRSLGAVTGLDFFKDILPNVGPDWGICVLPVAEPQNVPGALIALAVHPGSNALAVDQALHRALQLFAGLAVLDYNKNHPDAMRQETVLQDKVEVRFLNCDKLFPAGFQPAYALKDGYLVLASSPEAVLRFRAGAGAAPTGDTAVLRISAHSLTRLLRQRQSQIVAKLTQKRPLTASAAQQQLAGLAEFVDLFDRVVLSRRADGTQADWVLRIYPAE